MTNVSTDVKNIADVVKERMQGTIADLIPDEVFDRMLNQAVAHLITPSVKTSKLREAARVTGYAYSSADLGPQISPLQQIMEDLLFDMVHQRAKDELDKPEWKESFNGYFHDPSKAVKEAVEANADVLLRAMFSRVIGASVQEALIQFRNSNTGF